MNQASSKFSNKHESEIVFVINTLNRGGAAKILSFVANTLADYYDSVVIVTYDDAPPKYELKESIQIKSLQNKFVKHKNIFFRILKRLFLIKSLRKLLYNYQYRPIVAFISDVCTDCAFATFGLEKTLVGAERGSPKSYGFIRRKLLKFSYRKCDKVIFQTKEQAEFFDNLWTNSYDIIPNPYFLKYNKTKKLQWHYEDCTNVIVSAGRLVKEKDFGTLFKAFELLKKEKPDILLKIYGSGPMLDNLIKLSYKLKINKSVCIVEYDDYLLEKLVQGRVFVLSSFHEGIPNILLEAMGIGMPCIATDCPAGGPRSLIDHNVNGILVPPENPVALYTALKKVFGYTGFSKSLGKEAQYVKKRFSKKSIGEMWIKALHENINE